MFSIRECELPFWRRCMCLTVIQVTSWQEKLHCYLSVHASILTYLASRHCFATWNGWRNRSCCFLILPVRVLSRVTSSVSWLRRWSTSSRQYRITEQRWSRRASTNFWRDWVTSPVLSHSSLSKRTHWCCLWARLSIAFIMLRYYCMYFFHVTFSIDCSYNIMQMTYDTDRAGDKWADKNADAL